MGFLAGSSIGFGDVTIGGGSSGGGSSSNADKVFFKEVSSVLSATETRVASREATEDIEYELPNKNDITGNLVIEVINMNNEFNISVVDAQSGAIDESNPFMVNPKSNISMVLDKDNSVWKIINGI